MNVMAGVFAIRAMIGWVIGALTMALLNASKDDRK